jgi:hypothetical protein
VLINDDSAVIPPEALLKIVIYTTVPMILPMKEKIKHNKSKGQLKI